MISRSPPLAWLALASAAIAASAAAQRADYADPAETRAVLQRALAEREAAETRGARLEALAAQATEAAERADRQAAALAARIQQSEAAMAAGEARLALIERQRTALAARLAKKQQPIVRLTAALQRLSRRPLALSVLRPGSVRDIVFLRAMLSSAIPEVERRTAALRSELERGKALQRRASQALAALRASEAELKERRQKLAALATRKRLTSQRASGTAAREAERVLALSEQTRDLNSLVETLDAAAGLRRQLAALPGPIIRPPRPQQSEVVTAPTAPPLVASAPPTGFQLPVMGRTIAGFGSVSDGGTRSEGVTLAPRAGAQIVAPGRGRVAFAGPYRGYGQIVIIEHEGGWTSLITGLARTSVRVGEMLLGGAPLGVAGPERPTVTMELRREGTPVNPLQFLG